MRHYRGVESSLLLQMDGIFSIIFFIVLDSHTNKSMMSAAFVSVSNSFQCRVVQNISTQFTAIHVQKAVCMQVLYCPQVEVLAISRCSSCTKQFCLVTWWKVLTNTVFFTFSVLKNSSFDRWISLR